MCASSPNGVEGIEPLPTAPSGRSPVPLNLEESPIFHSAARGVHSTRRTVRTNCPAWLVAELSMYSPAALVVGMTPRSRPDRVRPEVRILSVRDHA